MYRLQSQSTEASFGRLGTSTDKVGLEYPNGISSLHRPIIPLLVSQGGVCAGSIESTRLTQLRVRRVQYNAVHINQCAICYQIKTGD